MGERERERAGAGGSGEARRKAVNGCAAGSGRADGVWGGVGGGLGRKGRELEQCVLEIN